MQVRLSYSFSATKGRQWGKDIYTFMCPLNIFDKLTDRKNSIKEQFKETYPMNRDRVLDYVHEIKRNQSKFIGEPVIISINDEIGFKAIDQRYQEIGIISFPIDANKALVSGHELKEAMRILLDEGFAMSQQCVIPIVIFSDEGFLMTGEHFAKSQKTRKSDFIGELGRVEITVDGLLKSNQWIKEYIDDTNKSLAKYSKKFFLKKHLVVATEYMLEDIELEDERGFIEQYWMDYFERIHLFRDHSGYALRQNSVFPYGTVTEAMGIVVNDLLKKGSYEPEKFFEGINGIDWSRDRELWKGNLVHDSGRILKNKKAIATIIETITQELKIG